MVRLPIAFDLETRDPDDVLTLCLLATHPAVRLECVTANPGTRQQIGVIRTILERLEVSLPIGARQPDSPSNAVSAFHFDWLGEIPGAEPDGVAHELLAARFEANPECVLLTGAPLHNLRLLLSNHPQVEIRRWVAQGGFAGDEVVPPEFRLPKFRGMSLCESFNFGGDKKGTQAALSTPRIRRRELVSKNVTHGVAWDAGLQARLKSAAGLTRGAHLAVEAMEVYLRSHPEGKLLHDPLAASAAVEPSSFTWAEVEPVYEGGKWGSRAAAGTGTYVTVAVDTERALSTLFAPATIPEGGMA